jgi:hypothetical protein
MTQGLEISAFDHDPMGNILIAGVASPGLLEIGNETFQSVARFSFLAQLSSDGKQTHWSKIFRGEAPYVQIVSIAVKDTGELALVVAAKGQFDLGNGTIGSTEGDQPWHFVVGLANDGTHLWTYEPGGEVGPIVFDSVGHLVMRRSNTLVKLDPQTQSMVDWEPILHAGDVQIRPGNNGAIYLAGMTDHELRLPENMWKKREDEAPSIGFVGRIDAHGKWTKWIPVDGAEAHGSLVIDTIGNVTMGWSRTDTVESLTSDLGVTGRRPAITYIMSFDQNLEHRWTLPLWTQESALAGPLLALDGFQDLVALKQSEQSIWLQRINVDGQLASRTLLAQGNVIPTHMTTNTQGLVYIGGVLWGNVNIGCNSMIEVDGGVDIFTAKLSP